MVGPVIVSETGSFYSRFCVRGNASGREGESSTRADERRGERLRKPCVRAIVPALQRCGGSQSDGPFMNLTSCRCRRDTYAPCSRDPIPNMVVSVARAGRTTHYNYNHIIRNQ